MVRCVEHAVEVEAGLKIVGVLEGSREGTGGNRPLVGASCAPEKIEEKTRKIFAHHAMPRSLVFLIIFLRKV